MVMSKSPAKSVVCILAAVLVWAMLPPAHGQDREDASSPIICTEPVAPTCMESEITYSSQQRIDRCDRTLQRYRDQLDDYVACLRKKIRQKRQKGERLQQEFERKVGNAGSG